MKASGKAFVASIIIAIFGGFHSGFHSNGKQPYEMSGDVLGLILLLSVVFLFGIGLLCQAIEWTVDEEEDEND